MDEISYKGGNLTCITQDAIVLPTADAGLPAHAIITMTMTAVVEAMETLMAVAAAITVRVRQDHVRQDHVRQNHVHRDHVHRDHARQDRVRHALAVRTAAVSSIAAA